MDRIIEPLRAMGATVDGSEGGYGAPLTIRGGCLHGIEYRLPMASAQVKGCVLFAGLSADGPTTVVEPAPTRAHTEELMAATGIDVEATAGLVTVHRGSHGPERLDDPVHGPTPDRPVAIEDRHEGHPGQHPSQQPDPRPRIAYIERSLNRLKAPTMNLQAVGLRPVNVYTECFYNGPGVGHVVAVA